MNDDYLWDRSGEPDPEIARLEQSLAPLRYRHRSELVHGNRGQRPVWWAAAAAVLLAAVATWQLRVPVLSQATGWQVASLEGASHRVGGRQATVSMSLRSGESMRTGRDSEVQLEAEDVGRIDLFPDSELHATNNRQVTLERGKLHAFIWARPGLFVVETPSARAVDLGCEYTINVDGGGNGLLRVSMGWVAFQHEGTESFIPAGAQCLTRRREGPGIPYFEDAPQALRAGVERFDAGDVSAGLGGILAAARPNDALTLWHLLTRVAPSERGRVFDRFAQLVTLPAGIDREGAVRRDGHTIDLLWDALNLENTDWWRGWERKW